MTAERRTLRIDGELGAGALATVVRVQDELGASWAAKILHASHAEDEGAASRFQREAEVVSMLEHPNVVGVEGIVELDGRRALLMELVQGPTLAEVIAREAPLAFSRWLPLARGVAEGLAAAHDRGIIHRDLKPANVLVQDGRVPKIADFGMARATSFAGIDRSTFTVLGTPDYMAPECLEPLAVDPRTDLYALGCMLHEMACGHPPYQGATAFAILDQHRHAPVPELPEASDLPGGIRALIRRLLAKSPVDRPPSARAVAQALMDGDAPDPGMVPARTKPESSPVEAEHGVCAGCGAPMVRALAICLGCALPQPRAEPGDHTVFVLGPGAPASKLDAELRHRLLAWIEQSPNLGVDPAALAGRIPRLPFAFVVGVSKRAGQAIVESLRRLGLEAKAVQGGRLALPEMRDKAKTMGGRAAGIIGASTGYLWWQLHSTAIFLMPAAFLGTFLVMAGLSLRPATRCRQVDGAAIPDGLAERLQRIAMVGSQLEGARHREALRGVVARAMGLRELAPAIASEELDREIGEALDVALVATGRLDQLDQELAAVDLREPSAESHRKLRERDMWSARLLDLTAALEALHVRLASATARQAQAAGEDALGSLRDRIDALEEVQRG